MWIAGRHYWYTAETGVRVDKTRLKQGHRALRQLGITLIAGIPRKRGAASSASFAPCKIGCRKSWRWTGSPTWRRRIGFSATGFSPPTTSGLPAQLLRRHRLYSMGGPIPRRHSVCAQRSHRGQRQYCAVSRPESADPARSTPVPLREGRRPSPRISGWHLGRVSWPAMLGALPRRRPADRDRTPSYRSVRSDLTARATDRSLILGQLCAQTFRRRAEMIRKKTGQIICYRNRTSSLAIYSHWKKFENDI